VSIFNLQLVIPVQRCRVKVKMVAFLPISRKKMACGAGHQVVTKVTIGSEPNFVFTDEQISEQQELNVFTDSDSRTTVTTKSENESFCLKSRLRRPQGGLATPALGDQGGKPTVPHYPSP